MSSADFDIVLLTPPVVYHELHAPTTIPHTTSKETRSPNARAVVHAPAHGLRHWSESISEIWPVLLSG